jgi:hypothetical protein
MNIAECSVTGAELGPDPEGAVLAGHKARRTRNNTSPRLGRSSFSLQQYMTSNLGLLRVDRCGIGKPGDLELALWSSESRVF